MKSRTRVSIARAALLTAVLATGLSVPGRAGGESGAPERRAPVSFTALKFNQPIQVEVKAKGVEWKGHTYHLLQLHQAEFQLGSRPHLRARVRGSTVTFDDVDYEVHAAVFGKQGELLGTAKALQPVDRIWLGKPLTQQVELSLDFGISEAYRNAATFSLAVSERKVLTPDQWTKQ